jgi:hypothetical protein
MPTSGTTNWTLNVAEIIETAARRGRSSTNKGALSGMDAKNGRNNLNMVLLDIANAGNALSKLEFKTLNLTQGTNTYTLPQDVIDVFDVVYAKLNPTTGLFGNETGLTRIGISEYNQISNKTTESICSQFAIHRGITQPTLYLYPTPATTGDQIQYWAMTFIEDATGAAQDPDLPKRYINALIAGTAYYISLEDPEVPEQKILRLKDNYVEALDVAFGEDRERASVYVTPKLK